MDASIKFHKHHRDVFENGVLVIGNCLISIFIASCYLLMNFILILNPLNLIQSNLLN
jgi:hypothetical protein